ncbi:MAG: protein kinase [Candidatus Sulfotelmatobacter sp.]
MTLASGTKLGPYEIQSALGAGGMGEVYRARDARLNREVAIKVLPAAFARDPERLRRFQQEAQAVAALNHPNILAVHDFGEHEGSPYLVTELLEGETLRDRLRPGALPLRKATDYGAQVARGLAAAHEKGIVHRDLKPENVFVTRDGRVKILDFGLAKLTHPDGAVLSDAATLASQTEPGMVMGTVGYMSPEQVKGQNADHRSDLFSLGAILYEMLSGKRAFHGETSVETMSAILKQDPPELTETNRSVPPALERVVCHCMEKNQEERFQSARDVAFDLANLSETSGSTAVRAMKEPRRLGLFPVVTGLLLALAIAGHWLWPRNQAAAAPVFHRLTYELGTLNTARFSPDGHTVVYSAAWDGQPSQIYTTRAEYPQPQAIGVRGSKIAGISPSNEIAFVIRKRGVDAPGSDLAGTLARVPLSGGSPREVLDQVRDAAWGPDGSLTVVHIVNGRDRLEYPIGKVLYETAGWISDPRFSRQGDKIAFFDHTAEPDTRGTVAVVDMSGHKQTLTREWEDQRGLAWSPNGEEVWFAASENGGEDSLRAVTLSGRLRLLLAIPTTLMLEDISADGRVLAMSADARFRVAGRAAGARSEQDLSWYEYTLLDDLSADGQKVLLEEQSVMGGPNYAVGVRDLDGSAPIRLGEGYGGGFSPDGKWVLSFISGPPPKITMYPTGTGEPKSVPIPGIERVIAERPGFFPDGKRIWFTGAEAGRPLRTYMQEISGGTPRPVTPEGVFAVRTSPDGKFMLAHDPDGHLVLFPVDGGEAHGVTGLDSGQLFVQWGEDSRSLYVRDDGIPASVYKVHLSTGKKTLALRLMPADPSGVVNVNMVLLSRDGKTYAYDYSRILSELMVVEGLK